jgi:DNA ligase-1
MAESLPDGTVLDGEALAWRDGSPLPFGDLQRRLNRKKVGPKLLARVPVAFQAYDIMEEDGEDVRALPLAERRERLESLVARVRSGAPEAAGALVLSPVVEADSWEEVARLRAGSRDRGVEGFMIKARDGAYGVGRVRGGWWKWKVEPLELDAVLMYAQAGHGRRAGLHTDYTFGVWEDGELVPVAKAYSGLTDAEIRKLDRWIRRNTLERFGPVRSVEQAHVFQLAFDGIRASSRHRSGVALRFPRISRWRQDKPVSEAATLEEVRALLERVGG